MFSCLEGVGSVINYLSWCCGRSRWTKLSILCSFVLTFVVFFDFYLTYWIVKIEFKFYIFIVQPGHMFVCFHKRCFWIVITYKHIASGLGFAHHTLFSSFSSPPSGLFKDQFLCFWLIVSSFSISTYLKIYYCICIIMYLLCIYNRSLCQHFLWNDESAFLCLCKMCQVTKLI